MGLPLFVAPVESDIPQKNENEKPRSTAIRYVLSPGTSRSTIRRLAHITAIRERAEQDRRQRTFEHHERRRALDGQEDSFSTSATIRPTRFSVPPPQARPPQRRPLPNDLNGLGDRERSLSPEGWDTLLTTLTPDPQPPSASTSFGSTVASQAPGQSATATDTVDTSMSEHVSAPVGESTVPEPPCDSGCENSDGEGEELLSAYLRRRAARHTTQRGSSTPMVFPFTAREIMHRTRRAPTPRFPTSNLLSPSQDEGRHSTTQPDGPLRQSMWIGRFIGTSDDEASPRSRPRREGTAGSSANSAGGEEELTGMQRIVRSLAHREDIPDDWWAEAGLSRSLSRE